MALRSGLTLFLAALACAAELPTSQDAWPSTWAAWNSTPLCSAPGVCLHSWETQRNGGPMVLERYWNQELVESGIVAFNKSAWRPLLAKLNAGQPITVLAFGSSIVEGHAGCFAVDTEVVHATGVATLPPGMNRTFAETGTCVQYGYLAEFMAAINSTWPNRGHVFVNAGRSAADLGAFAGYLCLSTWIPHNGVDLLLLESHDARTGLDAQAATELTRIVERLFYLTCENLPPEERKPAVVLFNMWPLLASSSPETLGSTCVRDFGRNCSACVGADSFGAHLRNATKLGTAEEVLHAVARHHGWASLSLRNMLAAGLAAGEPARLGWSECEYLVSFMNDWTHPGPQGRRAVADMLRTLLLRTQAQLDSPHSSMTTGMATGMPLPLSADVSAPSLRKCADGWQLSVKSHEGWAYTQKELVNNVTVYKPGWIASTPNATLTFEVNTRMYAIDKAQRVTLSLQYLSSYEHMGRALARCAGPCTCESITIDGHSTAVEHVSVQSEAKLRPTQSRHCLVEVQVQQESSSGEHKVKLLGYTVLGSPSWI